MKKNKSLEEQAIKLLLVDPPELVFYKDFLDFAILGKNLYYKDGKRIDEKDVVIPDTDYAIRTCKLSAKEVLEKFGGQLTEEQIKTLLNGKENTI